MTPLETLILATYFFILIILAGYGWHRYYLVYAYMKNRDKVPVPVNRFDELPMVTLQLPIYNEMYVVDRVIQSVCRMDYPRDRFEVQVLDDSTDETRSIAQMAVRRAAAQGVDITYLHRTDRTGYKAGALEAGMKVAKGDFIAIFDADFIPTEDFLMRTVPFFVDPQIAMVQARWGHINRD
ncbi:MAG TPA: glycosyltransferase, partial [Vicinamibacterales bacterium]|nr:glycosyltransferase [Vicinamibacterales bacterium]